MRKETPFDLLPRIGMEIALIVAVGKTAVTTITFQWAELIKKAGSKGGE